MLEGQLGFKGERGDSAYEIAVKHGYTGTEAQWSDDFLNAENYYDKTESDSTFVKIANVVDGVTSTDTTKPLSANQGKVLNDKINDLITIVSGEADWETTSGSLQKFSLIIPYPTGYTLYNTFVLGGMYWGTSIPNASFDDSPVYHGDIEMFVGSDGIYVQGRNNNIGDDKAKIRVAIMKTTINPWENV